MSEEEDALIIGAGVPLAWLEEPGIAVRDLPTPWGTVEFTMSCAESGEIMTEVGGAMRVPSGGIRVRAPGGGNEAVVRELPATVGERRIGAPRSSVGGGR